MLETPILQKGMRGLFALLFPDECRICGEPLREISRIPVCTSCLENAAPLEADYYCVCCHAVFLTPHPLDNQGRCGMCRQGLTAFDAAYSYGSYAGTLRELVHLFKYARIHTLEQPLGRMMLSALPREERFDLIVPLPMHWLRRWRRGFNQAELLAKFVGKRTGIPVRKVLRRKRATAQQAGLSSARRRTNVAGAFEVGKRVELEGRRVLLVDDVITTGSTAGACATALKRAGAARVVVLTLARTDSRLSAEPHPRNSESRFAVKEVA